jgi:Mrp family chromosome partitioning ATPase
MNAHFEFNPLQKFNLRTHYEELAARAVVSVVRQWWLISKIVIGVLVVAALLVSVLPRKYSAEALVQPQLFSRGGEGANPAPLASIDGASLVASEANLIQSPAIALAVVKRLGLERDGQFAPSTSLFGRASGAVRAAVFPESALSTPLERAADSLRSKLRVTRDTRSYRISIGFTATSAEMAANVANAFALEYLNAKSIQRLSEAVLTASRELAQRSTVYGEKHPSFIRAAADVETARLRLQAAINRPLGSDVVAGEGVTLAEPSSAPSSPNGSVILGLAFIGALAFGMGVAVWLDRQNEGLRTGEDVLGCTGVRCLGSVPMLPNSDSAALPSGTVAALRAVASAAGLFDAGGQGKVAMITSAALEDGTSTFSARFAAVLASREHRVLLVDTLSPRKLGDGALSLDEVLSAKDWTGSFSDHAEATLLTLKLSGEGGDQTPDVRRIKRLLADARSRFDLVLLAAPPVTSSTDTALLGRSVDATLHLVAWGRTPKKAVAVAIARLNEGAVHVNGIVLTEVDAAAPPAPRAWAQAQTKRAAALWEPHVRWTTPDRMRPQPRGLFQPVRDIWWLRTELAPLALVARFTTKGASPK